MRKNNFFNWFSKTLFSTLFFVAISSVSLVGASVSPHVPVSTYFYVGFPPISSQSPSPTLLTQNNSTRALALDASNLRTEPFSLNQLITFGDSRTRLLLFARNIDVPAGENPQALTADAEDGNHIIYPLQVEYVSSLGINEPTYGIHVRLNDQMAENGDVLVRLYFNGVPSNRVRVGLGRIGGGLPDDAAPLITQLSPPSVTASSSPFTLSINGSRFTTDAKPFFNGIQRAATVASESLLLVPLSSSDLQTATSYVVHVQTSAGVSNSVSFDVNNPQPLITGLSPSSFITGGSGFTLSVNGSGFVQGSVVNFNGNNRVTTFVSATLLMAQILASDVSVSGSFPVRVVNAAPGGGVSSAISLVVATPSPTPTPTPSPSPTPSGVISYATAVGRLSLAPSKTAYFRFTETSGISIADSSGGSHTGTLSGPVTLNQPSLLTGDSNPSALFSGGDVASGNFMPALTTGVSMAGVFQPKAFPPNFRYSIVSIGTSNTTGFFELDYQNQPGVFAYSFVNTAGDAEKFLFPTLLGTQQLNRTYHVAITHDFTSKTVKLYLDGMLVSTQTYTTTPRTTANQPVKVGNAEVRGYIDEVLVAGDRVLTDTDVRSLMRASVGADQSTTEFYVSPSGSYRNPGTLASPIDIYTAFRSGLAGPGGTYRLKGGTYLAPATGLLSYLSGVTGNPVRVKGVAGERAIIDGINVPLGTLDSDVVPVTPILTIMGSNTEYWNFEVTDSNPGGAGLNRREPRPTVEIAGSNLKLIGLIIYDTGNVFMGTSAPGLEIHSSLFFNNGWWPILAGVLTPTGHNIYQQNDAGRKLVKNSVSWGAASLGYQLYGSGTFMTGLDVHDSIFFMNTGWHSATAGGAGGVFFGGRRPITSSTIINNVAYCQAGRHGSNYTVGQLGDPHSGLIFQNNKSLGTGTAQLNDYSSVNWSNNLFIYTKPSANDWYMTWTRPQTAPNIWGPTVKATYFGTGNTYAAPGWTSTTKIWNESGVGDYNLSEWIALTGIDANAVIRNTTTNPYTSPIIDYKPNQFEPGRGFIAVFNPQALVSVTLNLSSFGLANGQPFSIYDVQNPFGSPLATGIYNSSSPNISVSMTGTIVRAPVGYSPVGGAASKTSSEFKTFMLVP
jgi:hypothetical protein